MAKKYNHKRNANIELSKIVSLLGKILGFVIKEQEGIESYNKIEKIRSLSKASRGKKAKKKIKLNETKNFRQLISNIKKLKSQESLVVARSFNKFLNFSNLAESLDSVHKIDSGKVSKVQGTNEITILEDAILRLLNKKSISKNTHLLKMISKERIRDEFNKIILSPNPKQGMEDLRMSGILPLIIPELEDGVGVSQNKNHKFTVWDHNVKSLQHAADKNFPLDIRLAALFHDVGKPRTKRGEGVDSTFYNHEVVGARMTAKILERLKYSKKFIEKVYKLVRWHLFFSDTDVITLSAVRRLTRNVGSENVWDLMNVRFCDRIGMGRPKEQPYRLRKYEAMIEEAMRAPLTVGALKVDGAKIMEITKIEPSPKVGFILHALLEEVLDKPELNTEDYLKRRVEELADLSEDELKKMGEAGKERKEKEEEKEVGKIRKKYGVR